MSKPKYEDYIPEMLKMRKEGKTNAEIAAFLNEKDEKLNATESSISGAIKRHNDKKNEKEQTSIAKAVPENQEGVQKKENQKKDLSGKVPPQELVAPEKNKEPLINKAPMKRNAKDFSSMPKKCQENVEIFSLMNDEFGENIEKLLEASKHKTRPFLLTGIWLVTIVISGFGGFSLNRSFSRYAGLYAMNMIGIPGGILIGLAISLVILYKTNMGEKVNKAIAAGMFAIFSIVLAVLLTIFLPGRTGIYGGAGLVGLTFLCLLFPKKKGK